MTESVGERGYGGSPWFRENQVLPVSEDMNTPAATPGSSKVPLVKSLPPANAGPEEVKDPRKSGAGTSRGIQVLPLSAENASGV
jgi:hypothetical protein